MEKGLSSLSFVAALIVLAFPAGVSVGSGIGFDVVGPDSFVATTEPATSVTSTSATLNGSFVTSSDFTYYFEYGLDTNYGTTTSYTAAAGNVPGSAAITGLAPSTTYHYRVVGATVMAGGLTQASSSTGADVTFTTSSASSGSDPSNPTAPVNETDNSIPGSVRCGSHRNFWIKVRQRKDVTYKTVTIYVGSKKVKVIKNDRWRAPVDIRGLPKGKIKIKIIVTTTDGRTITGKRKYHPCYEKLPGHKHKL